MPSSSNPHRELHLGRVQDLVKEARRWCPDATDDEHNEAILRLAHESAHARGLAGSWGFPVVDGLPRAGVRDLLDAAETILERQPQWRWPSTNPPTHQSGFGLGSDNFCLNCAWWSDRGCAQIPHDASPMRPPPPRTPACARWESKAILEDCLSCGACCREGYTLAPVEADEAIATLHPHLLTEGVDGNRHLARPGGLCVALDRSSGSGGYPCSVYPDRPRACAELAPGSPACLLARRRAGLSR